MRLEEEQTRKRRHKQREERQQQCHTETKKEGELLSGTTGIRNNDATSIDTVAKLAMVFWWRIEGFGERRLFCDTTKRLMSSPKCRSVEVINNPARPGSNHREVDCINYK